MVSPITSCRNLAAEEKPTLSLQSSSSSCRPTDSGLISACSSFSSCRIVLHNPSILSKEVLSPCINFSKDGISIDFPNDIKYNENILQAGPLLLKDSKIQSNFSEFVKNAHEFDSDITADRHPRTIFGFNDKYYFFLVIDGRTRKSAGLYLEECCDLVQQLSFTNAINLDGGASSTLIEGNRLINHPRIKLSKKLSIPVYRSERNIPTALIIVSDNFVQ